MHMKTIVFLHFLFQKRRYFETFSFLPPLDASQISKQVDYIVNNSFVPSLEFSMPENAYVSNENCIRFGNVSANYYDNRYGLQLRVTIAEMLQSL